MSCCGMSQANLFVKRIYALRLHLLSRVLRDSWSRSPKIAVLGRVRCVDQQPSGKPEVGGKGREQQQPRDDTIVTGEEEVQARVDSVSDSSEAHGVTHVTREDTPQDDGESKEEHVDTAED
ncbi:unnamed protein product [Pseudo-nitzschia multistriata]|uniref:Uncharacterized protein n=1 Tax=Pseudo-nitzschia multistriata TaxID=183589 RepID=A0A448ZQA3_9STRA|nr:unnamed protein product [Pseudo-nitzschia multistriata]